jgi:hypothetical protein
MGTSWAAGGSASADVTLEAGSLLAIIGDETAFADAQQIAATTELVVGVGIETIRQRAIADRASRHVSGQA